MTNDTKTPKQQLPLTQHGDLSADDVRDIEESIKETETNQHNNTVSNIYSKGEGSSVEGKRLLDIECIRKEFPTNKEDAAIFLSIILEDEHNQMWYEKLTRERRLDFLGNCLLETIKAANQGRISKSKAAYFTGVVKNKTKQLERIEEYKKKHTTLLGYVRSNYEK